MGKKKTVQKNEPWAPAQPYILENLRQQQNVFNSSQPDLMNYARMQRDTYGRLAPGAEAGIRGAQTLVNRNLSGANLNGNPYLDAIIDQRTEDVAGGVSDQFGSSGRFGSAMHAAILAREMAKANDQLRYQNYSQERAYQQDAIGQAQQLMGGSQSLLNNAAELPWIGVQAANGAVRQASGGYGTSTTTQSGGLGQMLGGIVGAGLSGWAGGGFRGVSDVRVKENVRRVGATDAGVPLYSFNYIGQEAQFIGPMAQEVALTQPENVAPRDDGLLTVDYGSLR